MEQFYAEMFFGARNRLGAKLEQKISLKIGFKFLLSEKANYVMPILTFCKLILNELLGTENI
jgi:hypothetical protein